MMIIPAKIALIYRIKNYRHVKESLAYFGIIPIRFPGKFHFWRCSTTIEGRVQTKVTKVLSSQKLFKFIQESFHCWINWQGKKIVAGVIKLLYWEESRLNLHAESQHDLNLAVEIRHMSYMNTSATEIF